MAIRISGVDHVVLYSGDVQRSIDFYTRVLGFEHVIFEDRYHALHFGNYKINLHEAKSPWEPHAAVTLAGSFDICLVSGDSVGDILDHLVAQDVAGGGTRLLQAAEGYVATIVAGQITRENDEFTGARPGRLVRS